MAAHPFTLSWAHLCRYINPSDSRNVFLSTQKLHIYLHPDSSSLSHMPDITGQFLFLFNLIFTAETLKGEIYKHFRFLIYYFLQVLLSGNFALEKR